MKKIIIPLLFVIVAISCGPNTHITKSWRDPSATIDNSKLNKVLISAFMKDETSRRVVEQTLVDRMKGKGVSSFTYFGGTNPKDDGTLEQKLKGDGFDGAVVLRFLNMDKELNYVPGTSTYPGYYSRYGGYYYNSWGAYSSPGYYTEDKVYNIETNIYSLKADSSKLIWSGVTQTTNPSKLDKMVTEIADVVNEKMRKEGFLVN